MHPRIQLAIAMLAVLSLGCTSYKRTAKGAQRLLSLAPHLAISYTYH